MTSGSPTLAALGMVLLSGLIGLPLVLAAAGVAGLMSGATWTDHAFGAAVGAWLAASICMYPARLIAYFPVHAPLLHPLGAPVVAFTALRALWLRHFRNTVVWRGRTYDAAALAANNDDDADEAEG